MEKSKIGKIIECRQKMWINCGKECAACSVMPLLLLLLRLLLFSLRFVDLHTVFLFLLRLLVVVFSLALVACSCKSRGGG